MAAALGIAAAIGLGWWALRGGSGDTAAASGSNQPFSPAGADQSDPRIIQICYAIAHAEGFGLAGALPTIRHNPGDIMQRQPDGSFAVRTYADDEAGFSAQYSLIQSIVEGRNSLYQPADMPIIRFAGIYTTGKPNAAQTSVNVANWAQDVATRLGLTVNDSLLDFMREAE